MTSTIHPHPSNLLFLSSATQFRTLRNPNTSPQKRLNDLFPSRTSSINLSQSERFPLSSSDPSAEASATTSSARVSSDVITCIEGIEDISDTQWAKQSNDDDQEEGDQGEGDQELLEAMELQREGEEIQEAQQRNPERARDADQRMSKLGMTLLPLCTLLHTAHKRNTGTQSQTRETDHTFRVAGRPQ